jgi:hypothetical protein
MDTAEEPEVEKVDENDPDYSKTGFWGLAAVLPAHQMRRRELGDRYLAAVGPHAETIRLALVEHLALSNWTAAEVFLLDLVDSFSADGNADRQTVERFWFLLISICEAKPKNFEELKIIDMREQLRAAMTTNYWVLTTSQFLPHVQHSQRAFERMVRLSLDLTENLRRQRDAASEPKVVVAVSQNAQNIASTSPPAAAQTSPLTCKSSESGSTNGHATASKGGSPLDRRIELPTTSISHMQDAAE